jgi:hypothetical protein
MIKIKKQCQHGEAKTFSVSSGGGYVRVRGTTTPDQPKQICKSGGYRGNTIALHSTVSNVTADRLESVVDKWIQKRRYLVAYSNRAPGICWCCGAVL